MALKSTYLAADHSGMERRSRALHRFLVASPIVLLIAVALVAHLRKPPYPHPAGNAAYDRSVLAYQSRVAEVERLRKMNGAATDATVEAEARAWVVGYRSGELAAVPPAVFEDHLREGARGEILRAGVSLSSDLAVRAERALQAGNATQAAAQGLQASEVAFGVRNFELQAYIQSLLIVRRGLGIAARAWPSLSPAERAALRPRAAALQIDEAEVEQMVELERDQLRDYRRRQKIDSSNEALATQGSSEAEAKAAQRSLRISNARVATLLVPDPKP